METNATKFEAIRDAISNRLTELEYSLTTRVVIYGIPACFHEAQIRVLQTIAKKIGESGDEKAWQEFNENVYVYRSNESNERMVFRRDGIFSNDFEGGFFSASEQLVWEIL